MALTDPNCFCLRCSPLVLQSPRKNIQVYNSIYLKLKRVVNHLVYYNVWRKLTLLYEFLEHVVVLIIMYHIAVCDTFGDLRDVKKRVFAVSTRYDTLWFASDFNAIQISNSTILSGKNLKF